jgi:uncharacterized membrane protein
LSVRDDVTNVGQFRDAQVIGQLGHDAKGVRATGLSWELESGAIWHEIEFANGLGWVNSTYMKRDYSQDWTPEKLSCAGTEPFWSIEINGGSATYQSFDGSPLVLEKLSSERAANRRDVWSSRWLSSDEENLAQFVIIDRPRCQDGMSPALYGLEIVATGLPASGSLAGCCAFGN